MVPGPWHTPRVWRHRQTWWRVMVRGCFTGSRFGNSDRVKGPEPTGFPQHSAALCSTLWGGPIWSGVRPTKILTENTSPHYGRTTWRKKNETVWLKSSSSSSESVQAQAPDFNPLELVWEELDRREKEQQPTRSTQYNRIRFIFSNFNLFDALISENTGHPLSFYSLK